MVSGYVPWIFGIFVVMLCIATFIWAGKKNKPVMITISLLASIASILLFAASAGRERPGFWLFHLPGTYAYDRAGQLKATVGDGEAMWIWTPVIRGWEVAQAEDEVLSTTMKLHPITDNPKVRDLSYDLVVTVGDDPSAMGRYIGRFGEIRTTHLSHEMGLTPVHKSRLASNDASRWLRSLLREVNEHHSIGLSDFYNPEDDAQQRKFAAFMEYLVKDDLATVGLELRSATFDLP